MIPVPKQKSHFLTGHTSHQTHYESSFIHEMIQFKHSQRCLTLAGDLHSGKSTLLSLIANTIHTTPLTNYSDFRKDEVERHMSIKSCPLSAILPDTNGKHYLLHLMDTPGHIDFSDEVSSALSISDGVLLLVDIV
jgi:U5 small nuclear ribonucleoprotein component